MIRDSGAIFLRCGGGGSQRLIQFANILESIIGLLCEAAHDRAGQFLRDVGAEVAQRTDALVGVGEQDLEGPGADERRAPREHEVGQRADAVQIAAPVYAVRADRLLGSHVIRRAQGQVRRRQRRLIR